MNWNEITIKTYDQSAAGLAEYFKGVGARVDDIERALKLAASPNGARVVEIGCGDGRDAVEIMKRAGWYQGFDPSEGLLKLARQKLPEVDFIKADAQGYVYPKDVDVVFAFASLLHIKQDGLKSIFEKVAQSLRPGGIFYISLKERETVTQKSPEPTNLATECSTTTLWQSSKTFCLMLSQKPTKITKPLAKRRGSPSPSSGNKKETARISFIHLSGVPDGT